MSEFVTERELSAHLDPMKADIAEIKSDVKGLVAHEYASSILGGRGRAILLLALPTVISVLAAVLIAIFLN